MTGIDPLSLPRGRGLKAKAELLDAAVAAYRLAALNGAPLVKAVAADLGVSYPKATKLVREARSLGALQDIEVRCSQCEAVHVTQIPFQAGRTWYLCPSCADWSRHPAGPNARL